MQQKELQWVAEQRQILSVSQLVHDVKKQLETRFRDIWVRGEISNLRMAPSGHCYFTLKDNDAQLKAVCFRLQAQLLKFRPQDGMDVIARGSISVYPPRGDFQLVIEHLEPVGPGALQLAFEQLKTRLRAEGLFEQSKKKKLPLLPAKIGIVTSPSGAAVQDVLRVLRRRNDRLNVLIFPVKVQGSGAAQEVARAIDYLNTRQDLDVLIVARGGGSLEDLRAFNEEVVARAIFNSRLPVISAVGHETDFTIADFVADLRAPTPSAAAEIVSAAREDLCKRTEALLRHARQAMRLYLKERRDHLQRLAASRGFVDAESKLRYFLQRLDELHHRLLRTVPVLVTSAREKLLHQQKALQQRAELYLAAKRQSTKLRYDQLQAYSPLAVLARGYAIVTLDEGRIVRDPDQVREEEEMNIRVSRGQFRARKV